MYSRPRCPTGMQINSNQLQLIAICWLGESSVNEWELKLGLEKNTWQVQDSQATKPPKTNMNARSSSTSVVNIEKTSGFRSTSILPFQTAKWSNHQTSSNVDNSSVLTRHDGLQARMALGRVLVAVALDAHQHVILAAERPIHQRSAALDAEEAFAVPVEVLVRQILQSHWKEGMFGCMLVARDRRLLSFPILWI